jgi:hypothetical protein
MAMKASPKKTAIVRLETHDELVENLPEIFRRLNDDPESGRLTLVNPILALEDIGFELSDELHTHLQKTLPFPEGRLRQIKEARAELRGLLRDCTGKDEAVKLPKTPRERAQLLFDTLGLKPESYDADGLTVSRLKAYKDRHPVAKALFEVGRLERGAIIFLTKGEYEAHKSGLPHHPWLKRLRFKVEG